MTAAMPSVLPLAALRTARRWRDPQPSLLLKALGIGLDDDGMPLPAEGRPPAGLAGRDLGSFDDLIARARAHTKQVAAPLDDAYLEREIVREHPNPETREARSGRVVTPRWTLYHLLEHEAGHYGQILLLRHALRAGVARPGG